MPLVKENPQQTWKPSSGPAIILIDPQLGENIGSVCRAMLNFGLLDLRLVRPRDGWPNTKAETMASGAEIVITSTKVFDSTREAVADLNMIFATTARKRDLSKRVMTPKKAANALAELGNLGRKTGLLFSPERSGLANDDIAIADAVINVPLNPNFSSLNLAHAVLLTAYEWFQTQLEKKEEFKEWGSSNPSTLKEREFFYERLESCLDESGFLFPKELAPTICRNLRSMFNKATLTSQEIRTLHGIVTALTNYSSRNKG